MNVYFSCVHPINDSLTLPETDLAAETDNMQKFHIEQWPRQCYDFDSS